MKCQQTRDENEKYTYAAKLINKHMILRAGIIKKWIGCSQSISMDFIINHSLHGITENLNRKRSLSRKTKSDKQPINSTGIQKMQLTS